MSNRRFMLLMVGLLILLGLMTSIAMLLERRQTVREERPDASVYNSRPSGYRAWMKTMEKAGLKVNIWRSGFDELERIPVRATMVIIEPKAMIRDTGAGRSRRPLDQKSVERMIQWVKAGNTLIFLDDFAEKDEKRLLLRAEVTGSVKEGENSSISVRHQPYRLRVPASASAFFHTHLRQPIRSYSDVRLQSVSSEVLLEDGEGRALIERRPLGKGTLILGTVPDLASNRYLFTQNNDNFQFFTNLVTSERQAILINEFVHGYLRDPDLLSYYMNTPLSYVLYQLLFLFLILLWASFRPWKPIRRDVNDRNNGDSMREYLQSMAGIYLRAGAAPLALDPQMAVIDHVLRRRYRIAPEETEKLAHLLGSLFADYDRQQGEMALDAIQKGRQAVQQRRRIPQDELAKLSRQLSLIQERLEHGLHKRKTP